MRSDLSQDPPDPRSVPHARTRVDLRIMGTTDLHAHLHSYDYTSDRATPDIGLSRLAELIDEARQQTPNSLLFDNGDFLQGCPVGDFFAYDCLPRPEEMHPVVAAMNALQYDAVTLGNHEFSYGLDFLLRSIAPAEFPVVSANILTRVGKHAEADQHLVQPYDLLHRRVIDSNGRDVPICIGVLGAAPVQMLVWERRHVEGRIEMRDMVEAVRAWVPVMRGKGADLIVLLAHCGIGSAITSAAMENALIPLARIDGVDAIIGGHTHQVFPSPEFGALPDIDVGRGTICGKPTVMSGFHGSHLGLIDLQLSREGLRWTVDRSEVSVPAVRDLRLRDSTVKTVTEPVPELHSPVPTSPRVREVVERAHHAVRDALCQPIGMTSQAINSFFVYLGHSTATALIAKAQASFVARELARTPHAALPLLSSVAPSKAGGLGGPANYTDIAAGDMMVRALSDLSVFPNQIAALRLTGAEIVAWLERSASAYVQMIPGRDDQCLMDPAHPGYNFEMIYGLDYVIDASVVPRCGSDGCEINPGSARVKSVTRNGQPLQMDREFILCTNSHRAQGAGGYAGAGPDRTILKRAPILRDVLRAYVTAFSPLNISDPAPFRLRPATPSTAILKTSPAALAHLDQIAQFHPENLGLDERGFLRLRIML